MAETVCDLCGQPATELLGELWICAGCAAGADVEVRVAPGGFRVYILLKAIERLAYLDPHEGDWTRAQLEALTRKSASRLREIAAS
jgi:hypothetical protein